MTCQEVQICALLLGKAGFLITRQKTLLFHVLLHGKAGFLMTLKKGANLWHYYVEKEVFSWRAKKSYILCIFTWKSRFLMTRQKGANLLHYYVRSRVSHDAQKRCKFVALLPRKAGFLMTRQNLLYFMHYYVEKQVFSWHAKKVQICCIITFRSRFSHHAPKTLIFDALLRGKAGFLMTCQKCTNLSHYYVEKQVFS